MTQNVAAVAGKSYTLTFYSGSHDPSTNPTVTVRWFNSSNVEIGTRLTHTITTDIDATGSLGGPYTLTGRRRPASPTSRWSCGTSRRPEPGRRETRSA